MRAGKNILGGFVRTPVRAGAHRENIFYFFTVYFLRAFSHAFWRTEDGRRIEEDSFLFARPAEKLKFGFVQLALPEQK